MQKELQEIGLSEQESIVYLELLKYKCQEASKIAKKTKINRSVIYSVLSKLIDKGLVSYVLRNNIKYFIAADPKVLTDFLKDKQITLQNILPALSRVKSDKNDKVTVEVYQGKKGGVAVLKDIIRTGKDYISIGDDGSSEKIVGLEFKQHIRRLTERKIKERILVKHDVKIISGKYSEVRYLPKEFLMPTITTIYGNKVAIAIFTEPYYCILINSKDLANSYRSSFELLWQISKK